MGNVDSRAKQDNGYLYIQCDHVCVRIFLCIVCIRACMCFDLCIVCMRTCVFFLCIVCTCTCVFSVLCVFVYVCVIFCVLWGCAIARVSSAHRQLGRPTITQYQLSTCTPGRACVSFLKIISASFLEYMNVYRIHFLMRMHA